MLHRTFHSFGLALLGLSVVLTAACNSDDPGLPTSATAAGELSASAQTADVDVVVAGGPAIGTVVGQSHLTRNQKGLRGNVRTSGLTPGHVATMWIVVFQDPDGCIGACDSPPEDFGPARAALALAGGTVVPSSGKVTITGKLDVGDATDAALFDTPFGSEVHLVIRTHGPVIPGMLDEQMGSLNGGCPPNVCMNVQAARYVP
jgi:hypothetical protein